MDYLNSFKKSALMLIYPDGYVDYELIDQRLLHMEYYIHLNNNSSKLRAITRKEKIKIPRSINNTENGFTFEIDTELAKNGIIVFHNLLILELFENPNREDYEPPFFYTSLPDEVTIEQRDVLHNIMSKYDISNDLYTHLVDNDYLDDVDYDEVIRIINGENKKGK